MGLHKQRPCTANVIKSKTIIQEGKRSYAFGMRMWFVMPLKLTEFICFPVAPGALYCAKGQTQEVKNQDTGGDITSKINMFTVCYTRPEFVCMCFWIVFVFGDFDSHRQE